MLVAAVLILGTGNIFAQSTVPAAGVVAVSAEDQKRALEERASALRRAAQEAPRDPLPLQQLSQTYAMLQQPLPALDAIERALALSPDSVEFLRARGTLATWAADYDRAQDSYRRLCALQPDDHAALLSLARVNAWGGRTDASVEAYRRYLDVEPKAASMWIELARTEAWRGNYSAAQENLETYRTRFGEDDVYSREVVAVLARSGRPGKALDTLEPMLRQHPDDYELNLTRTIALAMQRRTREATNSLDTIRQLQPEARDTQAAERVVRTVLASSADPGVSIYSDSSGLEAQRVAPRATVNLSTGTTIAAGYEHERLTAPAGSELAPINGSPDARHDHIWVTTGQQLGIVNFRGGIGREKTMAGGFTSYAIGGDVTPVDGLKLSVERNAGLFVVSPRTIELGLQQTGHRVQLDWSPTFSSQIVVDVLHQDLSDGNRRWELTIAPRRSIARTQRLNVDLGAVVSQLRTTTNFSNGYYDPKRYEYYAAAAYPYWKVSENIGIGLSLAVGVQRDDFSPSFRLGGNVTGEATFGIYNAWGLKVTGGETFNQRLGTGAFRGHGAGVSLIRRF